MPTASERVYRELLDAATEEERTNLEGQLVAICIAAAATDTLRPPTNGTASLNMNTGSVDGLADLFPFQLGCAIGLVSRYPASHWRMALGTLAADASTR